jgi:2-succinyl-5-enolpyruvyl-6-hydroxy-3-cyclohexene-1-carboxylate synthase
MTPATDTYLLLAAFVDELARCGMRAACTSPGSRCAPLVMSLAREQRLRCFSHVDERCAGFFALGLAKASGLPVAVACTSGTAAAELLPAAVEAREARVPLLLLTADRPPELRENGAGQAIDQLKLYGEAAKWFFEVGVLEASAERLRWMRTLACRAYWTTLEGRPGVVHLNFPLREPLVSDEALPADESGRANGAPYVHRAPAPRAAPAAASALGALVAGARRGVLIAGRHERATPLGQAAAAFAAAAGWPLLADPLSGARRGDAAIAHYDALLRDEGFRSGVTPDLVLRVGDLPVSKPLRTWLADLGSVRQVALDPEAAWQDPASVLSDSFALEPASALTRLASSLVESSTQRAEVEEDWLALWRSADERAAEAILGELGRHELSEPAVASELGVLLPERATLFVASSMPVRDIETFWPVRSDPPRVLCNRGANGIDGTVSAALGAAADASDPVRGAVDGANAGPVGGATGSPQANPVVLLIGDVALAHDIGGLLAAGRLRLKLTIVLLDNGGGGIFDFLPVSSSRMARSPDMGGRRAGGGEDIYTRHVATPTGLDFERAAGLYGLAHQRPRDVFAFRAALEDALERAPGSSVIEVRGDREANVELHRRMWEAVSRSLSPPAAGAAPTA